MDTPSVLSAFLALVPETHVPDHSCLNLVDLHVDAIERELIALDQRGSEAAAEKVLAVWRRMRRYYETRGRYAEGVRMAPVFRRAALRVGLKTDAAWILLKDDLWLRVLGGEQGLSLAGRFEDVIEEMRGLYQSPDNTEYQCEGGIGLYTTYRYIIGALRHATSGLFLPRTQRMLSKDDALHECASLLDGLRHERGIDADRLGPLEARLEQTSGHVALAAGRAEEALDHYCRAASLFARFAPGDAEHSGIVKCFQAQAHIALAELAFDADSYRGAHRFSSTYRVARRGAERKLALAIALLQSAYADAMRAGWAEGEPRINEHMARAFRLDGRLDLALMFAERSLEGYQRLGNQRHVGRVEAALEALRSAQHRQAAQRTSCDVLVVGRMRETIDSERVAAIQRVCSGLLIDGQPLRCRRVDHLVDSAGGRITDALIDTLWSAELVIAILDGFSANVFYEIGLAHGREKPAILCMSRGAGAAESVPFDLKDYHVVLFESTEHLADGLRQAMIAELQAVGRKVAYDSPGEEAR